MLGWLAKTQASLRRADLERRDALARRFESEAHLHTIIEAEPECIKIVDAQGDLLLTQVALRLKTCVREGDTVARMGSDEFVVMLQDLQVNMLEAATQAEAVGEQILTAFEPDFELAQGAFHSTPSIGISLFDADHQEKNDQPLKRAELAMFQAKAAGRNTLRFFDVQMQADSPGLKRWCAGSNRSVAWCHRRNSSPWQRPAA